MDPLFSFSPPPHIIIPCSLSTRQRVIRGSRRRLGSGGSGAKALVRRALANRGPDRVSVDLSSAEVGRLVASLNFQEAKFFSPLI